MKVLIDTNVFLSYVLAPDQPRVVTQVVAACLESDGIDLLVPLEQISEFTDIIANKNYFHSRIPAGVVQLFVAQLAALSDLQPPEFLPAYSRDPQDDYLIAYGVLNGASYLITGDKDLLTLERVDDLQIVTPNQFLTTLRGEQSM